MERKITFSVGEYYHVYNRGIEKRDIFQTETDRRRFQKLLYLANGEKPYVFRSVQNQPLDEIDVGEKQVAIGAYTLMPNHFHILIRETREGGLSTFMEKLATGYSKYFNMVNKRVGPLFQSRFKAQHVDRDEYLKYLFAYIHLNPVKLIEPDWKEQGIQDLEKVREYLKDYRFSSYADLSGDTREERSILTPAEFPGYFDTPMDFESFVKDWLEFREEAEAEETVPENTFTKGSLM
jgi:putative transposase